MVGAVDGAEAVGDVVKAIIVSIEPIINCIKGKGGSRHIEQKLQ